MTPDPTPRRLGRALAGLLVAALAACAGHAYFDGNARLERGDYAGAIRRFDAVLAADPAHFGALLNRGVAYEQTGRLDEALADYDGVLALVPDLATALYYRGHVFAKQEDYERAVQAYDAAIEHADVSATDAQGNVVRVDLVAVHYDRGNALHELGRYREAVESYDRALAIRPGFPPAEKNRRIVSGKLEDG